MRTVDPALPRIGTDFMTLRVVMRIVHPRKPLRLFIDSGIVVNYLFNSVGSLQKKIIATSPVVKAISGLTE
jgi:hypothetical protein